MSSSFNFVTLPLTTKRAGQIIVPQRSGLNWGQRPGRSPNQAYLSVPADIQRSGFFPERGEIFIIECDDGFLMSCVRAQANGKGIESPTNNSIIGSYFGSDLGSAPGIWLLLIIYFPMAGHLLTFTSRITTPTT